MMGRGLGGRPLGGRTLSGRGLGKGRGHSRGGGASDAPLILLSSATIAEDAADNTKVGDLSVTNPEGTYVFTITSDPDNKFAIANDDELIIDELLDYETATSHQVTIEADPDVGATITRTFTITVTDVAEAAEDLPHFTIMFN